ncbi:MAG: GNAT family N-acetyltransferase, partial [Bacteroidales bacterium]|nr:GNAT family N-acetyltransferase [Bacteroidales bacterium]
GDDKVIGIIQTPCFRWAGVAGLGYWLAKEYRGQGYMTEAVQAVKEILFDTWWCDKIMLYVYEGNDASRRVAVKCGFHLSYEDYKECAYSAYGRWVSKECFVMTSGEYEWERRGEDFYTTASTDPVPGRDKAA